MVLLAGLMEPPEAGGRTLKRWDGNIARPGKSLPGGPVEPPVAGSRRLKR